MAMENKRIIQLSRERTDPASDDYVMVDSPTGGTAKFLLKRVAETDDTLTVPGKAADSKKVGDEIDDLKSAITNAYGGIVVTNLIRDKYIVTEDGSLATYYGWSVTEYFDVSSELEFTVISKGTTNNNLFYDSNKAPIQPRVTINEGINYLVPPSNAKYVRFSGANDTIETMKIFVNNKSDKSLSIAGGYADAETVGSFNEKVLKANGGVVLDNVIPNKYLIVEDGSEGTYYGWSATDFINVTEGTVLFIYVSESTHWNMFYDSNKEMIQPNISLTAGLNTVKVVSGAKYVRFSSEDSVISGLKIWVTQEIPEEDDPLKLPDYYNAYIQNKISTLQNMDDEIGYGGDRFIFITDTHYYYGNTGRSPAIISKLQDATYIGMTVFGGDAINAANTEDILKYRFSEFFKDFKSVKNFYPIIGNHEFYSDWAQEGDYKGGITFSEVYAYFNKSLERIVTDGDGLAAYYIDNTIKKIRYYFVGCDYYVAIPAQTKTWLINSIQSIPSGYTVIFMGHRIANNGVTDVVGDFADIHPYIVTMNAGGNSICPLVLCGHTHLDGMFVKDGIHYVATTTDNHTLEENPNLTRTEGTTNEQAFDVVSIDTINKHIYFTRIGGGSDRDFSYS